MSRRPARIAHKALRDDGEMLLDLALDSRMIVLGDGPRPGWRPVRRMGAEQISGRVWLLRWEIRDRNGIWLFRSKRFARTPLGDSRAIAMFNDLSVEAQAPSARVRRVRMDRERASGTKRRRKIGRLAPATKPGVAA